MTYLIPYAKELVNKTWLLKDRLKEVDAADNLNVEQKVLKKRDISIEVSNFTLIFNHYGLLATTVPSFSGILIISYIVIGAQGQG